MSARRNYDRFLAAGLGAGLAIEHGGEVIAVTSGTTLARVARADPGVTIGIHVAALQLWGEEAVACRFGVLRAGGVLNQALGDTSDGISWDLSTGQVRRNGAVLGTAAVTFAKQADTAYCRLELVSEDAARLLFYYGQALAFEVDLTSDFGSTFHFALSLAAPASGGLRAFVNLGARAGRWPGGVGDGWGEIAASPASLRPSSEDYLSAANDDPPNTRWEGCLSARGIVSVQALAFWPWGERTAGAAADLTLHDPDGRYDDLIGEDLRDQAVALRTVTAGGALDYDATPLGRFVVERLEAISDAEKRLVLRDALVTLDAPLQRDLFAPFELGAANRPRPLIIGACRNIAPVLVDDVALRYSISDQLLGRVAEVRDQGDPLLPADYTLTQLGYYEYLVPDATPNGLVTVDASSEGPAEALVGVDVYGGYGDPFTESFSADAPNQCDSGADSGDVPYFLGGSIPTPIGGAGKPAYLDGCVFPEGPLGESAWLEINSGAANTLAAGKRYRFTIAVQCNGTSRVGLSTTMDATGLLWSTTESGYYQVTVANPTSSPVEAYIVVVRSGAPTDTTVTLCRLEELTPAVAGVELLPATLEQALRKILTDRHGIAWRAEDAADIDVDTGYAGIGFYASEPTSLRACLQALLRSYTASTWQDGDGRLRLARLVDPEDGTPVGALSQADLLSDLVVRPDNAPGLSATAGCRKNWTVFKDADFVADTGPTGVPLIVRDAYKRASQVVVVSSAALSLRYAHARLAEPVDFLFESPADAQTEIDRVGALYTAPRNFYTATVSAVMGESFVLGQVWTLSYPRYGLAAGRQLLLAAIERNWVTGHATLTFWG